MTKSQNLIDNEMWKDTPPVEVMEIHAKEFAEWVVVNGWHYSQILDKWYKGRIFTPSKFSTSELYQIFNKNKDI